MQTQNAQLVCLSKSQFAIIVGKVHDISNMKSPPLKNQPTNQQNSYILPEKSPIQKLPATEHTAANLTLKAGSREMTRWSEPSYTPCTGWQSALPPGFQPWGNGKRAKPEGPEKTVQGPAPLLRLNYLTGQAGPRIDSSVDDANNYIRCT